MGYQPLNLYSLGSSFFLMLIDDEARDPVKLDLFDSSSLITAIEGLTFSSWAIAPVPFGGFLPNGLRNGGIAAVVYQYVEAM